MDELSLDIPIRGQKKQDERPKFDLAEAIKGRPIRPFIPRLFFKVGEDTAVTNHAEAKALMTMLDPAFRTEIEEFDPEAHEEQLVELDIPLELFQNLLKWTHIHGREGKGVGTRQLRKLDMKNLVTYTKIYLQGEGIVEKDVLKNIIEYVEGLVIRATAKELSDFAKLANSAPFWSKDKKFKVLKKALVMRLV
jgi:hypothetical protein